MASRRNFAVALLLCCVAAVVVADLAPGVVIQRPRADRGSFKGADVIEITGTGFRTYSEVMCFFGDQFASYEAVIASDTRIQCRTPRIESSDSIFGFPLVTSLSVMFDGIPETETLLEDVFVLGPTLDSFSPSSGFVDGGNSLTLHGTNFDDFEKIQVFLDEAECPVTTREDERVICTVPAGDFNQNALVSMVFEENEQYYLHSRDTYHYGPVFTAIEPQCSNLVGGTVVTLIGFGLDDPILNAFRFPEGVRPTVELVISLDDDDADVGDTRYFGTDVIMNASGGLIEFTTPFIPGDVFGFTPEINVYFKQLNSRAVAVPGFLTLGPIVYTARQLPTGVTGIDNPSPQAGHRGGGDIIVVSGCGLADFTNAEVSVLMDVATIQRELCVRGAGPGTSSDTLTIFEGCNNGIQGCDQIFCFTNPEDCTFPDSLLARQVTVAFTPVESQYTSAPYVLPREGFMTYAVGPSVDTISIDRSDFTGGEPFTITGTNFFEAAFSTAEAPGWGTVTVNFEANGNVASALATIVSDTQLVGVTPAFDFNTVADVSVDFQLNAADISCTDLPRDIDLDQVFFGPVCTAMSPSNGHLSGGQSVTLTGVGFLAVDAADIEILLCLERLNPLVGLCDFFEPVDSSTVSITDTQITFVTPSSRQNVPTNVGSNRLFGDVANVYVRYGTLSLIQPLIYCGDYRFGPEVASIVPQKGPSGPLPSPNTPVNIRGSAFNDPAYNTDLISFLGEVVNSQTTVRTRNQPETNIDAFTNYTDEAGVEKSVNVIFGAANTTTSDFVVSWGPAITSLSGPFAAPTNAEGDVWGLLPSGGQQVTVFGEGFEEYLDGSDIDARCLIDGVEADLVAVISDADVSLVCTTPAVPFGSEARLSIDFGSTCGENDRPNYRNRVTATQRLYYTPRIDSLSPDYGLTSGGQQVTVHGEGFEGWSSYECFFSHYSDQAELTIGGSNTDSQIVCTTPFNRGEFGTDVTVHIELNDPNDTDIFHMKVVSPVTYHYGAVCNGVSPASGNIDGGYTITILGDGFIDCVDSDVFPFSDCTFNSDLIQVFFDNLDGSTELRGALVDILSVTDTTLEVTIPGGVCMEETNIFLVFEGAFVSDPLNQLRVDCGVDAFDSEFHYGPVFSSQFSEFSIDSDSYGWGGDEITITGFHFDDPALGEPICQFGGFGEGVTTFFNDTTIFCTAPEGAWDTWVPVVVEWPSVSNSTAGCDGFRVLLAGFFHYGPELSTISPVRGYVRDQTEVTITGFAFECCGIDSYEFVWPSGALGVFANQTTYLPPNSVSAPVPQNDAIDNQVNFIGVRFGSPLFNASDDTFLSRTGDDASLNFYYGPFIDTLTPERSSLSGEGISVTINGEGFLDPYFTATYCDFISTTGGFDDLGATPSFVSDTQIVCPVKTFNHFAGDIDDVRPRWDRDGNQFRNNYGFEYVKTGAPVPLTPFEDNPLPFFRDNGGGPEVFLGPLVYGPVITDVSSSTNLRSPTEGGLSITVTFDDISDWLSSSSRNDYGSETAVCLFGDVRISEVVPINSDNTVVCEVPRGYIGLSGAVSVVLDPHFDDATTIAEESNKNWRYLPYLTNASNTLGQEPGYETITIQGGGFCSYDTAVCTFGGREAVQADITNDFTLTCQTPPRAPGEYPIEVSFCQDGNCFFDSTRDRVQAADTFRVAGVTSITPPEGSLCGGTEVTFIGHGFELYDFLTCQFGGFARVNANRVNDTAATCFTPNFELNGVQRPIQCMDAVLVGHKGSNEGFPMLSPIAFEAGFPQPQSTDPKNADVDFSVTVTVIGRYFNGGFDREGEYFCSFGGILTPAILSAFTEGDLGDKLFALTCPTPTRFTNPELTVGEVDFEVIFDCGTLVDLSSSSTKFRFGQVPRIFDYNPKKGEEIGGTTVTVTGDNFAGGSLYLCSFGELGVDNQVVAAHFDPVTSQITCETPAHVVDRSERVDFHLSIDGGIEWTRFEDPFTYQNVVRKCDSDSDGDDDDDSSAGMLVAHLLPVVLALCALFL